MNYKAAQKRENGFSLIELLVVVTIIGLVYFFLIWMLDYTGAVAKTKNAVIRSTINKVVLSVEGFRSSYNKLPSEADFLNVLNLNTEPFEESCTQYDLPDYECLFKVSTVSLRKDCDLSSWRNDTKKSPDRNFSCFMRYYAGGALAANQFSARNQYRIIAPMWGKEFRFMIYDSSEGGKYYSCPASLMDQDEISTLCEAI